jgi:hypothetical protein
VVLKIDIFWVLKIGIVLMKDYTGCEQLEHTGCLEVLKEVLE